MGVLIVSHNSNERGAGTCRICRCLVGRDVRASQGSGWHLGPKCRGCRVRRVLLIRGLGLYSALGHGSLTCSLMLMGTHAIAG